MASPPPPDDPSGVDEGGPLTSMAGPAESSAARDATEELAMLQAAWTQLAARIGDMGSMLADWPDTSRTADGIRYLLRFLAAGIRVCVELDDTEHPGLGAMVEPSMTWGLDNPDCNYRYTRLDGTGTYRITGRRGSARHLELQVNTGHLGDGDFTGWQAVCSLTGDDLHLDADGAFTVLLSPRSEPTTAVDAGDAGPAGGPDATRAPTVPQDALPTPDATPAHRLEIDERASFLLVRQYFGDWTNERPAHLTIERLDRPVPPAPVTSDAMARRLALLGQWLEVGGDCWHTLSRAIIDGTPGEIQPFLPPAGSSGLKGLAYGFGPWHCTPDQALLIELTPPECRLWGLSLCDRWWQSIDYAHRQSSLNSHQAELDDRGTLLAVVCHDDPGINNWLDPGGETQGTIALRYLLADDLPPARVTTVARSALADHLPATATRVTPDQRRTALTARRAAVETRFGR